MSSPRTPALTMDVAYFADDITFDTVNAHYEFRGIPTVRKPGYLKDELLAIENKIGVLYHIQGNNNPNPFNSLWLNILQARSASLVYSVNQIVTHLDSHGADIRHQHHLERLCGYIHCHLQILIHDLRYVENRVCILYQ